MAAGANPSRGFSEARSELAHLAANGAREVRRREQAVRSAPEKWRFSWGDRNRQGICRPKWRGAVGSDGEKRAGITSLPHAN